MLNQPPNETLVAEYDAEPANKMLNKTHLTEQRAKQNASFRTQRRTEQTLSNKAALSTEPNTQCRTKQAPNKNKKNPEQNTEHRTLFTEHRTPFRSSPAFDTHILRYT